MGSHSPDQKSGNALKTALKVCCFAAAAAVLAAGIYFTSFFVTANTQNGKVEAARKIFNSEKLSKSEKFSELKKQNADFAAWLKFEGGAVDNPVYRSEKDGFYSNHDMTGEKSRYGALRLPKSEDISLYSKDKNTVIFGNNISDGAMFGSLKNFRDTKFYEENHIVTLTTEDSEYKYYAFAVCVFDSASNDINFELSNYDEDLFSAFKKKILERSLIKTGAKVNSGDRLLTLITDLDDFEGARLAVVFKRVNDAQIKEYDSVKVTVNADALYPDKWYKAHTGG